MMMEILRPFVDRKKLCIQLLLPIILLDAPTLKCQLLSIQPTPVKGSNFVVYQNEKYKFFHKDTLRYEYSILPGSAQNEGTFNVLRAYADNQTSYLPSNHGGIRAVLNGEEIAPRHSGVSFLCLNHEVLPNDTLIAYRQMNYSCNRIKCKYKFKIERRTLMIRVEIDDKFSNKAI